MAIAAWLDCGDGCGWCWLGWVVVVVVAIVMVATWAISGSYGFFMGVCLVILIGIYIILMSNVKKSWDVGYIDKWVVKKYKEVFWGAKS